MLRSNRLCVVLLVLTLSILHLVRASTQQQLPLRAADDETKKMAEQLETSLLSGLGLKRRPNPKTNVKIPDYLLKLYEQQTNMQLEYDTLHLNVRKNVRSANTVRTFFHQDTPIDHKYPLGSFRLKFDMSGVPQEELITASELRLYQSKFSTHSEASDKIKVLVYDIIRPATKRNPDPILRLIDSKTLNPMKTGWVDLDVFPAVLRWTQNSRHNHGLYIKLASTGDKPVKHEHVRLKRNAPLSEGHEWPNVQPLLVTYSDDGKVNQRTKRGARRRKYRKKGRRESCKRHELYVNFSDVGWTDWIVAPPGYKAYFCHGFCEFPVPDHLNSTNHAVVQTLVNSVKPDLVPRACCVPTEMSGVAMLYQDEYDRVVLKNYPDMAVVSCGCR